MLGWSEAKKWSYAVAEGKYERTEDASEITEIDVHHYGWDGAELVTSWAVETELKNYLANTQDNAPPRELFANKMPRGRCVHRPLFCGVYIVVWTCGRTRGRISD